MLDSSLIGILGHSATNFVNFLVLIAAGCPIILPRENESVLLGAAILGAVAAKRYSSLIEAMKAMNAAGQVCMIILFYFFNYPKAFVAFVLCTVDRGKFVKF